VISPRSPPWLYLIEASSYDEAVARVNDHPHLEYGGTLEIRKPYEQ
jgi:hypothetical protein